MARGLATVLFLAASALSDAESAVDARGAALRVVRRQPEQARPEWEGPAWEGDLGAASVQQAGWWNKCVCSAAHPVCGLDGDCYSRGKRPKRCKGCLGRGAGHTAACHKLERGQVSGLKPGVAGCTADYHAPPPVDTQYSDALSKIQEDPLKAFAVVAGKPSALRSIFGTHDQCRVVHLCPERAMPGYPCRRGDANSTRRYGGVFATADYFGCDKAGPGAGAPAVHGRFYGPLQSARASRDYRWHRNYCRQRQRVQDLVVFSLFDARAPPASREPWTVYLAGPMGVGKSFVRTYLSEAAARDPFEHFAAVDMDEIRAALPEWPGFLAAEQEHPECRGTAAPRTQVEAGYLQELLVDYYIERGTNMIGDGSLIDADWYEKEFKTIRKLHLAARQDEQVHIARQAYEEASLAFPAEREELARAAVKPRKIAIIHVTNPSLEQVKKNALARGEKTGREVSVKYLEDSFRRLPKSMAKLRKFADVYMEFENLGRPHLPTLTAHEVRRCDADGDCSEVLSRFSDLSPSDQRKLQRDSTSAVHYAMRPILEGHADLVERSKGFGHRAEPGEATG